eukprot:gene6945-7604_t
MESILQRRKPYTVTVTKHPDDPLGIAFGCLPNGE